MKKITYLIPDKHASPVLILNQFPYFSIREIHSEVEVAHPKLQKKKKKGRKEKQTGTKVMCEQLSLRFQVCERGKRFGDVQVDYSLRGLTIYPFLLAKTLRIRG